MVWRWWWCWWQQTFETIATTENLELRAWQAIYGRFISLALTHAAARCFCVYLRSKLYSLCVLRWYHGAGLVCVLLSLAGFRCSRHHIWSRFCLLSFFQASTPHTLSAYFFTLYYFSIHSIAIGFAHIHQRAHLLSHTHAFVLSTYGGPSKFPFYHFECKSSSSSPNMRVSISWNVKSIF